jgi:cyclase
LFIYRNDKDHNNEFICLSNYGREISNKKLIEWFSEAQQLGVGEIILTSIYHEGMGNGFDLEMLELFMIKLMFHL